jgi:hypothetical protein
MALLSPIDVSAEDRTQLPLAEPRFEGKVTPFYQDSEGTFPKTPTAPDGAPNIVLIMLDDLGFGQAECEWRYGRNAEHSSTCRPRPHLQ